MPMLCGRDKPSFSYYVDIPLHPHKAFVFTHFDEAKAQVQQAGRVAAEHHQPQQRKAPLPGPQRQFFQHPATDPFPCFF